MDELRNSTTGAILTYTYKPDPVYPKMLVYANGVHIGSIEKGLLKADDRVSTIGAYFCTLTGAGKVDHSFTLAGAQTLIENRYNTILRIAREVIANEDEHGQKPNADGAT